MSDETQGAKPNYINKLQTENAEKDKEIENLKAQLEAGKPVEPVDDGTPDDREDIVEVTYGVGQMSQDNPQCFWKKEMTKQQALDTLYSYFIRRKANQRMIPREGLDGDQVVDINTVTCYLKFTKTDVTGKVLTSYKDMPLWLAAERKVNHPRCITELVKKSEYQNFYDEKAKKEIEGEVQLMQMYKQRNQMYSLGK